MIEYIIYTYFAINLFLAGYYLGESYGWAKNNIKNTFNTEFDLYGEKTYICNKIRMKIKEKQ
jgi:hypothetical protein